MSATRAWIVATSVGAVEALKDQGFCRWNHAFRSIHHNARNTMIGSISQAKNKLSSSLCDDQSASAIVRSSNGRLQESEESLRKVMFLSCRVCDFAVNGGSDGSFNHELSNRDPMEIFL